jgi:hypothetical protein
METVYILQFQLLFQISFNDVVNIEQLGADSNDDGIYHFISRDVYSFDTFDNIWVQKNEYQTDVLQRISFN